MNQGPAINCVKYRLESFCNSDLKFRCFYENVPIKNQIMAKIQMLYCPHTKRETFKEEKKISADIVFHKKQR